MASNVLCGPPANMAAPAFENETSTAPSLVVRYRGFFITGPVAAIFFVGPWFAVHHDWQPASAWLLDLVAGGMALVAIAWATRTRVLSDERGRWSLSRLQLVLWTSLILPTLWTMAVSRMAGGAADPVAFALDDNLWLLLGIPLTSAVASPLILQRKEARLPGLVDRPASVGVTEGQLGDLFRGEDAGSAKALDLGRVQVAFFTAVTLCVYFVACWHAFAVEPRDALAFPPVSQNLVALLGISHATYLANKNTDRPASTPGR
jgi:hypothetical protein